VTEQELQALLSQKDLTTTFAENLLKQFENEDVDVKDSKLLEAAAAQPNSGVVSNSNRGVKSPPIKCEATSTSVLLKKYEIKSEPVIKIEKLLDYETKPKFSTKMSSKEIYAAVK
jgi:histone demethylase